MMRAMILGTLMAGLLSGAAAMRAQDDDKIKKQEQEDEAKKKIAEFNKAKAKCKSDDDWRGAIDALASMQHAKILKELSELLKAGSDYVKIKVAELIGKYKNDKSAADYLLAALGAESGRAKKNKQGDDIGHEVAVAVLAALGDCGVKTVAEKIHPFFRHQNIEIAKAAIRCCGQLKSLATPEHLIKLLQEMEQSAAQSQAPPGNPPPGTPPPGGLPPGAKVPPNIPPGVNPGQQMQQEQARRKSMLEPLIHAAYKDITGNGPWKNSVEMAKDWAKSRPALEKKEKEAEKK